jgi:hypothetical protein
MKKISQTLKWFSLSVEPVELATSGNLNQLYIVHRLNAEEREISPSQSAYLTKAILAGLGMIGLA